MRVRACLLQAGNSMHPGVVRSWKATVTVMLWDEIMLILGLVHSTSGNSALGWGCFGAGCMAMVIAFVGLR